MPDTPSLSLTVNGSDHVLPDRGQSLLDLLRDELGFKSVKDGCSPQGQCGCCTVLVDGNPRVACVTPARRVRGRSVTTLEGLEETRRNRWAEAMSATGASQCGFCTPGIILRLEALGAEALADRKALDNALLAHLCRCTGWQTILETAQAMVGSDETPVSLGALDARQWHEAGIRAGIEGRSDQRVGPEIALGEGGFVADTAPADCLIALVDTAPADGLQAPDVAGADDSLNALADTERRWVVAETMSEARTLSAKVQGRRTTASHSWPLEVPAAGNEPWAATLRTTWVEPAYLEPDAAWCEPGGEPVGGAANGGSFGAKDDHRLSSRLARAARELADIHGRAVLVLGSREDVTRFGPKRPPVAGAMTSDGSGVLRIGISSDDDGAELVDRLVGPVAGVAPGLIIEPVVISGPPVSSRIRAAGWAEAVALRAAATGVVGHDGVVTGPDGGRASATVDLSEPTLPSVSVWVDAGQPLDVTVLRSYCIGAAHMAWSWVRSESLTVDDTGQPQDLTIRSFGIVRAVDTPRISVEIAPSEAEPVNGSDAVFAAVAASTWLALGAAQDWPVG